MDFDRRKRNKHRVQLLLLAVSLSACIVLSIHWLTWPRGLAPAGLLALALVALIWKVTGRIVVEPLSDPRHEPTQGQIEVERLQRQLQTLEAHLEHAPVALFKVQDDTVAPINIRARRTIAPGYARNADALYEALRTHEQAKTRLISLDTERGVERALTSVASITVNQISGRIFALMPVESELEAATTRAWQQLVHVLTHEIMNSLTAVGSLSRSAHNMVEESASQLTPSVHADLSVALRAIGSRADGLIEFVTGYRSLSTLPQTHIERVSIADLLVHVSAMVASAWRDRGGTSTFLVDPPSLELMADPRQLEQALLGLIRNAFEATALIHEARLEVRAYFSRGGRLCIDVTDNGPGIPDEIVSQIFTPFFSTKARNRGIGLALVRQLVHSNGGTVRYAKSVAGGARFVITF